MDAAIEAQDLGINRGRIKANTVIPHMTFSVETGSVTGLLGPSGCGKTTLMRAIIGVQRYQNTLTVLGNPAGSRRNLGRIGYVTQQASIYPNLSVKANLDYFAALNPVKIKDQVDAIIDVLGLAAVAHRPAAQLSGGQRGRVSLGCALVGKPELLVLDEPTVGLDPVTRDDIWTYLRQLSDTEGTTLLVSSHVMDEALRCDAVLLMREGALLAHDTPAGLLRTAGTETLDDAFLALIKAQGK